MNLPSWSRSRKGSHGRSVSRPPVGFSGRAPRFFSGRHTGAVQAGRGQRVTPLQGAETLPRDVRLARAAAEPLVPGEPHVVPKGAQAPRVPGDPVVREVPAQFRRQGGMLLRKRQEAVFTAPLRYRLQGSAVAVRGRLPLHPPGPCARWTPVMGGPPGVKRAGTLVPGARWGSRA